MDDPDHAAPPARGARVGRYLLVDQLDDAGLLWSAYDPELDRKIALEFIAPGRRVAAEAAARLRDPHVVTVHEVGADHVVTELVEGRTLEPWLAERKRARGEILAVMRAAGAGLAAGHRAGIVHGGFTPASVLVAHDETAKVTDFGLAIGEPAYTAPEGRAGAASDQFSFAAVLHRALWGEAPAAGSEPPRGPGWLRRLVKRGLAARPEERWPSLDAMVTALDRGTRGGRRRGLAFVAVVLAGIMVATLTRSIPSACDPGAVDADPLAGVWDAARRPEVERSAPAAVRALDAYAVDWRAARREVCEATKVRHEESEPVLALRNACLDRRRGRLRASVEVLAAADAETATHAAAITSALGSPWECDDAAALAVVVPVPGNGPTAASVAAIVALLDRAEAEALAGHSAAARVTLESILPTVRLIGHQPLVAETLAALGAVRNEAGDRKGAQAALDEAMAAADLARDDATRNQALVALARLAAADGRPAAARAYAEQARALARRRGNPRLETDAQSVLSGLDQP